MKHLSSWRKRKRVPRQRQRKWCPGNILVPITRLRYRCKRASVRMCETCKRWWGAPGYRVPTGRRHGKRGGTCTKQTGTVQTYGSSHTTCIRSRASSRRLYLRSVHFRSGSGLTVVGVVVHGSPREVVVHGDGSGTRFRKCSGSSVEVLDVHGVDARVTHVVGVLVVPVLASVDVHGNRSGTWRCRVVELDDPRGYLAQHRIVVHGSNRGIDTSGGASRDLSRPCLGRSPEVRRGGRDGVARTRAQDG